jgi:cell division protein FtsW
LIYLPIALVTAFDWRLPCYRRAAYFGSATVTLAIFTILVLATFVFGTEIKGARRWIALGPMSVQPSEFLKPAFAVVVAAWLFASARTGESAARQP